MSPSVGIVTGAGRGMGAACARRLAADVDVLLVVDRDEHLLNESVDTLTSIGRAQVEPWSLDVTSASALAALAGRVADLGLLRACVHAAGVSPTMADWERI